MTVACVKGSLDSKPSFVKLCIYPTSGQRRPWDCIFTETDPFCHISASTFSFLRRATTLKAQLIQRRQSSRQSTVLTDGSFSLIPHHAEKILRLWVLTWGKVHYLLRLYRKSGAKPLLSIFFLKGNSYYQTSQGSDS